MESVEIVALQGSIKYWSGKRVLVTGASGMVGSWLTRWLAESGAYTVAFIADTDPQSELVRSGTIKKVSVVNGRLENYDDIERAINNHEVDSMLSQLLVLPIARPGTHLNQTFKALGTCLMHVEFSDRS